MTKFLKTILMGILLALLTISLSLPAVMTAQAQYIELPDAPPEGSENTTLASGFPINENLDALNAIYIKPDNIFYSLKLGWESLQESIAFDPAKKALLQQEHLQNRIQELKYEVYLDGNKNTAKVLQEIQAKQLDIGANFEKVVGDGEVGQMFKDTTQGKAIESQNKKNIEVLNNLLTNATMSPSSRKGLMNAVNKSGMKLLTANMAQGNFKVSSSIMSMLPFRTAMIYEPTEKQWYSVIISRDSVDISKGRLAQPDVTLYPTVSQMDEFKVIAVKINKNGLTWDIVGRIMKLWYSIRKTEVN